MLRAVVSASLVSALAFAQTNFPPPPTPAGNPRTPQKELLGMALFFEEQLSSTGTVACATCHDLRSGGIDTRTATGVNPGPDGLFGTADDQHGSTGITRIGAGGVAVATTAHGFRANVTRRRAPTVINSGYHPSLAYDGSRSSLEALIAVPPLDSTEMGHVGRTWTDVATKLAAATPLVFASELPTRLQNFIAGRSYPQLFQLAYGSATIDQTTIVNAIACYLRTLNSDQSNWDKFLHGQYALTPEEQLGFQLFTTPANGATACSTCHGDFEQRVLIEGPIVGQMTQVVFGPYGSSTPTRLLFHNVGVRPIAEDIGRQGVTNTSFDAGKFRVASLRNVALTAPYFHNGGMATLDDVVEFYNRGGDFHANQAAFLTARNYTVVQKQAIVALLETLTDPRVAAGTFPFDQPVLGSQAMRHAVTIGQGETTLTGRTLVLGAPFAPRLGEAWFRFTLQGATVGTPAFLMFDLQVGNGTAPFNVQLGLTPAFTMVGAGVSSLLGGVAGAGVQVPLPLPADPALSGQALFAQALSLEASTNWPLATSNALYVPLR